MPAGAVVISTIETVSPFLATQTAQDMVLMKLLTDRASTIIWLTAGDLLAGHRPELALSSGLARAIMFEQPSSRFINYDIDNIDMHTDTTAENIVSVVQQADALNDFEFIQKDGIVHIVVDRACDARLPRWVKVHNSRRFSREDINTVASPSSARRFASATFSTPSGSSP